VTCRTGEVSNATRHTRVLHMQGPAFSETFSLLVRRSWMLGPAEPLFDVGSTPSDPRARQACEGPAYRAYVIVKLAWVRDAGPAVRDACVRGSSIARPTRTWVLSVTTCASVSVCGSVVIEPTMYFLLRRSGMLGPADPPGEFFSMTYQRPLSLREAPMISACPHAHSPVAVTGPGQNRQS
jgi:hypothetical protein